MINLRGMGPSVDRHTLIDILENRAAQNPDLPLFTFLEDGEKAQPAITSTMLASQARAIAVWLEQLGLAGERILLLFPQGTAFIAAFFGCAYAGAISVPAPMPDPSRVARTLPRLQGILADAAPAAVLTNREGLGMAAEVAAHLPDLTKNLKWLAFEDCPWNLASEWHRPALDPDKPAHLQYTSGSTATPKGTMITHANIMANSRAIQIACRYSPESRSVVWEPYFHDDGLIQGIIQPIFTGFPCILMAPSALVARPDRWLRAISRFRGTHTCGPNFAYELCRRKVTEEQSKDIDLSSLIHAQNAAEPVRAETLKSFFARFQSCGLRWNALSPNFGLAEATLMVSSGLRDSGPLIVPFDAAALEREGRVCPVSEDHPNARLLVSSGLPLPETVVAIVDPQSGAVCPSDHVGEIWVKSPGIATGYLGRPEESERTFRARLDNGDGPYLRTGDQGFLLDGDVFVTGRIKDMIIIRGENRYPQDIELSVERSHPAIAPGNIAAFSIDTDNEERLVVIAEIKRGTSPDTSEMIAAIAEAITQEHELTPWAIALLSPGALPKTSSGKIQRGASRKGFLENTLQEIARWTNPARAEKKTEAVPTASETKSEKAIQEWLSHYLATELGIPEAEISVDVPFSLYGMDSAFAVRLAADLGEWLNLKLPSVIAWNYPNILALSRHLHEAEDIRLRVVDSTRPATNAVVPTLRPGELFVLPGQTVDASTVERQPVTIPPIPKSSQRSTLHPLSAAQNRIYFLDRVLERRETYNVQIALHIDTVLSAERLKASIARLVERHDQLRMCISEGTDGPLQRILPWVDVPVDVVELRTDGENSFTQLVRERAAIPFDLTRAPLLRVTLAHIGDNSSGLLLVWHHIATDGWSIGRFLHELESIYSSPDVQLPAVSSYPELTEALRLDDIEREEHRRWWAKYLDGAVPLDLPADYVPSSRRGRGSSVPFTFDGALSDGIDGLARTIGVTPFVVLLSGWAVAMQRYCRQDDLTIGVISGGRTISRVDNAIGLFVDTVPLRCKMEAIRSVAENITALQRSLIDVLAHERLPLDEILNSLPNMRFNHIGETPLLRACVVLENSAWLPASFAGAKAVRIGNTVSGDVEGTNKFDIALAMIRDAAGYRASIEYAAGLFEPATIRRLTAHFGQLLTAMVASPQSRLSDIDMITPTERHQVVVEWNSTVTNYPRDKCIHELFEEQVGRSPSAVAAIFGEESITYSELDGRANHLAQHLRSFGVGPDVLVGLCVERSIEMVVAVLGILKAGGAYVPFDPTYPRERIAFMLRDANVVAVLTQDRLIESLPDYNGPLVRLDSYSKSMTEEARGISMADTQPENLAYVMYTSGSTGTPKGVCVTHRNVVRLVTQTNYIDILPSDRVAQASNSSFDAATFEIWGALLNGACIVGVTKETALTPDAFASVLAASGISILFTTTALFNLLVQNFPTMFRSLRYLLFGGEAVDPTSVRIALKKGPQHLLHVYGPTETTTFATYFCVDSVPEDAMTVPIGIPIANTTTYILDTEKRVVPIGVAGELYIGGDGVARGYHQRPEMTAERFVWDQFSSQSNARLYKTGDLCRYRADGNIEFLGRLDDQVKIRGFRIELGEIEVALSLHASVRECVVIAREGRPGDKRLVAYVVSNDNESSVSALRVHLTARLPDYMIPALFVFLDKLPLTPNGKIDRKALPAPEFDRPALSMRFVAARTRMESMLTTIWREVLALDGIGVHDNFFEIGGNSLLSIRLISRAAQVGLSLTVRQLFESPTIRGLAKALTANEANTSRCIVPLRPNGSEAPIVLIPGLAGTSMVFLPLRDTLRSSMPIWTFDDPYLAHYPEHPETIEALVRLWIAELLAAVPDVPAFRLGGYSFGGMVAVEMARQLIALGKVVDCVLILDGASPTSYNVPFDPLAFAESLAKQLGASDATQSSVAADIEEVLGRVATALGNEPLSVVDDPHAWARAVLVAAEKNHQRMTRWQVRPVEVPIILLRAVDNPAQHADLGWSAAVGHPVPSLIVPGDHQTMIKPPYVQTLAFCVEGLLAQHTRQSPQR